MAFIFSQKNSLKCSWYNNKIAILLWLLAPLAWGILTQWGPPLPFLYNSTIYYQSLKLLRTIIAFSIIFLFFGRAFEHARKYVTPLFFNNKIPLPSWFILAALVLTGIGISFWYTPLENYPIIISLVQGVLICGSVEELITRSIFIKYSMTWLPFIMLNTLSSITFALMHIFYDPQASYLDILTRGHFEFSFVLGIITYKVQRIEFPIILHMFSNLPYPLVTYILKCPYPPLLGTFKFYIAMLCIIGCSYTIKTSNSKKSTIK